MAPIYWTRCHGTMPRNKSRKMNMVLHVEGDYCTAERPPGLSDLMVDKLSVAELTCAVCLDVFTEATGIAPCGHVFCYACVSKVEEGNKKCPCCKIKFQSIMPAWVIRNLMANMEVRCKGGFSLNSDTCIYELAVVADVCKATVKLSNLKDHELSCPYMIRACKWRNSGCEFVGPSESAGMHEAKCRYKTVPCSYCAVECFPKTVQEDHAKNTFSSYYRRGSTHTMEYHLEHVCKEKLVMCPYSKFGCVEVHKRDQIPAHECHCPFQKTSLFFEAKDTAIRNKDNLIRQKDLEIEVLKEKLRRLTKRISVPASINERLEKRMCTRPEGHPKPLTATNENIETLSPIFIQGWGSNLMSIPVCLSKDTPESLFEKITQAWSIPSESYYFRFRNKVLDSTLTFASQNVERDSTLFLVPSFCLC